MPAALPNIGAGAKLPPLSLIATTAPSDTPAASVSSRARWVASATARLRASSSTGSGSARPKLSPSTVFAPSFTAASSAAPSPVSARTRTVSILLAT